jgi:cbb3-type cytochrome oxidase subunit 3
MLKFNKINNLFGWLVFAIALATYVMTVERTASFWDCGEFIACSYKLEVPHPPGAPLFLLIGRIFSMFAMGNVTQVAYWVNMVSVVGSAFTILFLFWTVTMIARKMLNKTDDTLSTGETVAVLGSGLVASLAYAWSESFWFSAVEAEVYGLSSFFTAIVIWAAFKWERIENEAAANRWLIFTFYLIGLSIGVHLLNLVTLPALALIYYFKKNQKSSLMGGIVAFLGGLVVLAIINSGVIVLLPSMASSVEVFMVNSFGLPYSVGIVFFLILFIGAIVWAFRYANKKNSAIGNTMLLCFSFVLIGYASYFLVLVRSNFNPPINENDPSDAVNYVSYLKREQYGSRPLLYGPVFTGRPIDSKKGDPIYRRANGKYVAVDFKPEYIYEKNQQMLLPRMHSNQGNHPELYRQKLGLAVDQKPSMGDNLKFMFSYQMGHMYWRYFMWNFVGRASDNEGADWMRPWDNNEGIPKLMAQNRGRNNFYMIPFILGLLGIVGLFLARPRDFVVTGLLFLMMGLALVVYLNSPPVEPRERDYIYVGSFYIFALWIGLGVMFLYDSFAKILNNSTARATIATVLGLVAPTLMVAKGWDNHNRNNRYHSVDFAKNLLNSCAPNAILFTGGDNDTFPLWYIQEVEGFRTDVRVCNLSLLGTDWYISQMKRKTYDSEPLPISLEYDNFGAGKNDIIPFYEMPQVKAGINLKEYMGLVKQSNAAIQVQLSNGDMTSVMPSSNLILPVNPEAAAKLGVIKAELLPYLKDTIQWSIGKRDLYKSDLIMLDIIATNDWKRPVYFAGTLSNDNYLNLKEYMQVEGYAYRLLPVRVPGASDGYINSDIMYKNMMEKTYWRELNNPNSYYPEEGFSTSFFSARIAFMRLIDQLIREGKNDKAKAALNKILTVMPDKSIPYDQISSNFVEYAFKLGDNKRAIEMANVMATRAEEELKYGQQMGDSQGANLQLYIIQTLANACRDAKQTDLATKYDAMLQKYSVALQQ